MAISSHLKRLYGSRSGVGHWWMMRISSIFFVLLCMWAIGIVSVRNCHSDYLACFTDSNFNLVFFSLFLSVGLWRGVMVLESICYDHIKNDLYRYIVVNVMRCFTVVTVIMLVTSIL